MSNFNEFEKENSNLEDMDNPYKMEIDLLKNDLKEEIENLKSEIVTCKKEIKALNNKQLHNEELLGSHYHLLNVLLIDYDLKPKGILRNIQILCQELLDLSANICEKNDLNYWLIGGNLLGAIRHGGYIPWDDDMDIGLMRKEFHKFNEVAGDEIKNNGLSDYVTLKVLPKNDNYPSTIHPFTKLDCLTPDNDLLAGIDVFPYDYANDKNFTLDDFCNIRPEFLKESNSYDDVINEYYNRFNLDLDDGKYVIPNPTFMRYADRYKKDLCFYDKDKIFPLSKIEFNGRYYNCPNDLDYFLLPEYEDYMNIPKVIRDQHNNVDNLRKIDNINEYFDEYINKLKECNENFKF